MAAALRTVLVPVDGSDHSKRTLDWYCKHLNQEGDAIILLHVYVVPEFEHGNLTWPAVKDYYEDWGYAKGQIENDVDKMLEWYAQKCTENCLNFKIHKVAIYPEKDTPGQQICKVAEEHKADLIIMNHRGTGTIADRGVLGSTSDYCVCNANISVCMLYLRQENPGLQE